MIKNSINICISCIALIVSIMSLCNSYETYTLSKVNYPLDSKTSIDPEGESRTKICLNFEVKQGSINTFYFTNLYGNRVNSINIDYNHSYYNYFYSKLINLINLIHCNLIHCNINYINNLINLININKETYIIKTNEDLYHYCCVQKIGESDNISNNIFRYIKRDNMNVFSCFIVAKDFKSNTINISYLYLPCDKANHPILYEPSPKSELKFVGFAVTQDNLLATDNISHSFQRSIKILIEQGYMNNIDQKEINKLSNKMTDDVISNRNEILKYYKNSY